MKQLVKRQNYLFLMVFAAFSLCPGRLFSHNLNIKTYHPNAKAFNAISKRKTWAVHELKTGHYNHGILINTNNPLQLINYRTVKLHPFMKFFLIGIFSLSVGLTYLKYNLKSISSEYARFLKLLLFPNHVFW